MRTLSIAAVILCLSMVAAAEDLVTNGSFEYPACAADNSDCFVYYPGQQAPGWTVEWAETVGSSPANSPGVLEIWRGERVAGVTPQDGQQIIELDTHFRDSLNNANIQIYQSLATCPGANYTLNYSWRPRPGVSSGSQGVAVKWGGSTVATHTGDNLPWQDQSPTVVGSFGLQQLMFIGTGTGNLLGTLLDAVSLIGPDPDAANACTMINIKPFSDPNSINVCSSGSVPVTIWGSENFDVTMVDPNSLRLGGAAVRSPGKSGRYQCSISDSGSPDPSAFDRIGLPDEYPDLTCQFTTEELMFSEQVTTAVVQMTLCDNGFADGCSEAGPAKTLITAVDDIRIVKDGCE